MSIGYHEIDVGMVFVEVTPKKSRRVTVIATGMYSVAVQWTSARGVIRTMSAFRKHLSDPTRWTLVAARSAGGQP